MIERTLLITDNQHVIKPAHIELAFFKPYTAQYRPGKQLPSTLRIQAALLALVCFTGSVAIAEDSVIDTITVTASRLPLSLNRTGAAVTVINQETIRNQGAQNLADLLLGYPGISVSRQGPNGTLTQVRMRGAEANHVLVLIDGVEANDVTQGSEFNFAQFPIDQIERIEINRGPQSALWGSDALAGVIHITTRPRSSNKPRTTLTTALGNRDANRVGIEWGNRWNSHQLDLGFNHSTSPKQNIARVGSEQDGSSQRTATLGVRSNFHDALRFDAQVRHTRSKVDFDAIDFSSTGLPTDGDNHTDSEGWLGSMALRHQVNDQFTQSLTYQGSQSNNHTQDQTYGANRSKGSKRKLQWLGQWQSSRHGISAALERETERYVFSAAPDFFGDPNQSRRTEQTGISLEYLFTLPTLTSTLSVRNDDNSDFGNASSFQWQTRLAPVDWPFSISAALGKGIKNPSFIERFGYYTSFLGNPALDPETSESWDIGLHVGGAESAFRFSLHVYASELKNEINGFSFSPALGAFTAINEDGISEREGIEFEGGYQMTDLLNWRWSYQYTRSTSPSGELELRRPKHTGFIGLNASLDGWQLSVNVKRSSDISDLHFPPTPPYQALVSLPGYTLVSMGVRYALSERWEWFANVENSLNESYEEVFGYRGSERQLMTGFRWMR